MALLSLGSRFRGNERRMVASSRNDDEAIERNNLVLSV